MASSRNKGLDLSRVIVMYIVVTVHIYGIFISYFPEKMSMELILPNSALAIIGKSVMGVFFMTSGAFLIGRSSTMQPKEFYKKTWKKLGIPTLIFTVLHLILNPIYPIIYNGSSWDLFGEQLLNSFLKSLRGIASDHLWYMFVLIGLYILAPFIAKSKEMFGEKGFMAISVAIFIWGLISSQSEIYPIKWSIGHVMAYVGLFMMGYVLYRKVDTKRSNGKAALNFLIAFVIMAGAMLGSLFGQRIGIPFSDIIFAVGEPYNLLNQIAALFLFMGFAYLSFRFDTGYISGLTYWVYLAHVVLIQWVILLIVEKNFGFFANSEGYGSLAVELIYGFVTYILCLLITHVVLKLLGNRKKTKQTA